MEQKLDLVFVVAPEQEVMVAEESPVADLIDQVLGKWDSVSVLKKSGLAFSPIQFRCELEKLSVSVCPKCSRYCLPERCNCDRLWSREKLQGL